MKLNPLNYAPSWQAATSFGALTVGTLSGIAIRAFQGVSLWTPKDSAICKAGFSNSLLNGINSVGQEEIKWFAPAGSICAPIFAKAIAKSDPSRIVEIVKSEITREQKIAGGLILGVGMLGSLGVLKPLLQTIFSPIPQILNPSGHFLTKVMTSALGFSITKSLSANCTPEEKRALITCCALNALKDTVLLCGTIANQCHSIQEVVAGSLVALAGIAGTYYLVFGSESKELSPSTSRMEIKSAGPGQFTVTYGTEKALIDWASGDVLEGSLPSKVLLHASVWAACYRKEIEEQPDRALYLVKKGAA